MIVDGDTIYGDGVNVAARIEALCEPGGVWLSRSVYNQVRGKLDLALVPSGLHQVKNISEAVETFRVALDGVAPAAPRPTAAGPRARRWVLACRRRLARARRRRRRLALLAGRAATQAEALDRGAAVRQTWAGTSRPGGWRMGSPRT